MYIPYRTAQIFKRSLLIGGIVLTVLAVILLAWFTWLQRFVVYTRDEGAVLDFTLSEQIPEGVVASPPPPGEPVNIYYNEGENAINTGKELTQLAGYYVDREALIAGVDTVRQQAKALDRGTPIMLEVKSALGNFFYSSSVSEHRDSKVDIAGVDELIKELDQNGHYLIARVPALRDRMYGLHNVDDGVFDTRGAYLFRDDGGCYWLNPSRQGTLTYLVQTTMELKNMGFDEVVYDYFDFPDTTYMRFNGDKQEALIAAAQTLMTSCGSDSFTVSFVQKPGFTLPTGRSRLYIKDAAAADAVLLAQQTGLADPNIHVVFLTEIHDTRFDEFGVLRPLDAAH